jgi:hypothetical protein
MRAGEFFISRRRPYTSDGSVFFRNVLIGIFDIRPVLRFSSQIQQR